MTKLSDKIFQGEALTCEDANKVEILATLTDMNDLLKKAKDLHKQLIENINQASDKADELNNSGYFDEDIMERFMFQLDEYQGKISEGLEESPLGMLSDNNLVDSF